MLQPPSRRLTRLRAVRRAARLRRPGALNLYVLLASLPLAGLLPLAAFAALLIWLLWSGQQQETRRDLQQSVSTLAVAVDRELVSSVRRLQVLSRVPDWQTLDSAAMHAYLQRELAANADWLNLSVVTGDGRMLLNAALDRGAPAPHADRPHHREVAATDRPVISDIYNSLRTGEPAIAVSVPLPQALGSDRVVLSARLDPAALSRLLADQGQRALAIAAVYDRNWRMVARNRDGERLFGQLPQPAFLQQMQAAESGVAESVPSHDGVPVVAAWQRLPSGWSVAIGVPASVYAAPLERSMKSLALIGLTLLALQVLVTMVVTQRLVDEVQSVGDEARRLAAGRAPTPRRSSVRQFDALRRSLYRTGRRLAWLLESERRARADAEAASRAKDEFIAMLGHELRNPMAAIGNASRLLGRADLPGAARSQTVGMLHRQVEHMRRLVDDLLDVSRVLAGKVSLDRQPQDLRAIVEHALATLRTGGQLDRHTLRTQLHGVPVQADAVRLEQVVINLVGNAAKYTPEGGSIEVRCGREGDQAVLAVRDDGVGMTPELIARAFDLFAQGDQELHRASGGLGLGLTLVRRLVQLHDGTIEAHSDGPGRGSTFTMRLPAADGPRA